ncbi:MAG: ABC transporter substrate-binding protein [Propionibacteriaceae bacterium]|nr:ABC transporter substrate-binding protein [Propionibacteriaceae bacterium]
MSKTGGELRILSRSHKQLRTFKSIIAAAVVFSIGLTGCGTPTPSGSSTTTPNKLVIGATLEPANMDPFHNTAASIPQVLLYNVYETLVKLDSDGQLRGLLARSWDVSPNRKEYTFFLDPAAKFASGAPIDANAVVANITRMQDDPRLTETLRQQLEVVDSAVVVDATHVRIELKRPSMMWLYEMSSTLGMIVDPTVTDITTQSAGSGPYVVKAHRKGQSVILEKNEAYWDTPARFDEVTFRYYDDPNAMNASMLTGDLDIISNLQAPDALPQFSDTQRFTVTKGTTNGEIVLGLNHHNEALAKLEVRQALTKAIDKNALLDTVWNGQGTVIGSMSVPTDPWYEDLSHVNSYDPEGAKALLKAAGYETGLKLRFRVPVVPYALKSAQFVASQLRDIGVETVVEELEFSRWIPEVLTNGDYDMTIVAHVEARDLGKFADENYYWHYGAPEFVRLYNDADQAESAQSVVFMRDAARFLADDAAAIWLFVLPSLIVTKANVIGVPENMTSLSFDLTSVTSR